MYIAAFGTAVIRRWVLLEVLLQQRRRSPSSNGGLGTSATAALSEPLLIAALILYRHEAGVSPLMSPRVVELLINAGADTSSAVCFTNTPVGEVVFSDTPLAFTIGCLRTKKEASEKGGEPRQRSTGTGLRMPGVCFFAGESRARCFLAVVHGTRPGKLCLWGCKQGDRRQYRSEWHSAGVSMLPILTRRRRGVLSASLFRWEETRFVLDRATCCILPCACVMQVPYWLPC